LAALGIDRGSYAVRVRVGDYHQSPAGVLVEVIGGTTPDLYGQIIVHGSVSLTGAMRVKLVNGFTPGPGDTFTIILAEGAGAVTGHFAGLPEGQTVWDLTGVCGFVVSYAAGDGGDDVTLTALPARVGLRGPLFDDLNNDGLFNGCETGLAAARPRPSSAPGWRPGARTCTRAWPASRTRTWPTRTRSCSSGPARRRPRPPKLDAQVLAAAPAVYVTNQSLAVTAGVAYGFLVTETGVGTRTCDVGANAVANGTSVSVLDLLLAVDARSHAGLLYDADESGTISAAEAAVRTKANDVFGAINELGGI
jgi:hypothetical protein